MISSFCFFYGVMTILIWAALSFFASYVSLSKFWKKHIKKRKNIYFLFGIITIIVLWMALEEAANEATFQVVFGIHMILFVIYSAWSGKKAYEDWQRIKQADARRNK
jgi:uncharacterized membrane protein YfcA